MPVQTTTKDLGTVQIRITQLEPRHALRTFVRACGIFGEEGVNMIVSGTVSLEGSKVEVDGTGVLTHIVRAFAAAEPDDVLALADDLLMGVCSVKTADGWNEIPEGEAGKLRMNELFPSVFALLGALKEAMTFNFLPTSGATDTDANTSDGTAADR